MGKTVHFTVALALGSLLTACGGSEPSAADIKAAYEFQAKTVNGLIGTTMMEVLEVKKHECKARTDSNAFVCTYTIKMKLPLVGDTTKTDEDSFIKGDDGWRLL